MENSNSKSAGKQSGFRVTIPASGHSFVAAPGQTLLDAALSDGLHLPYGCRSGSCGSCKAQLLSGAVSYPFPPPGLQEEELASQALLCIAHAESDVALAVREVSSDAETEARLMPVRVVERQLLAHDVMELKLQLPRSERLQYLAGQYVDIVLPGNKRRSFSLANAPFHDKLLELHVRKVEGGAFTTHVFETMRDKALMRIHGPLGSFYLREDSDRPIVLVAGGTGFAPMKAMLEQMLAAETKRPVTLYWGVRAVHDLYQHQWLETLCEKMPNLSYIPVLSEPESGDNWQGSTGFVHEKVQADFADMSRLDVYLAGPPPMINACKSAFFKLGLPEDQLWFDSFEFSPRG